MGGRKDLFRWILIAYLAYLLNKVSADSFLINCGSHDNLTIGERLFLGGKYTYTYLDTPTNILADTSINTSLDLYRTAIIFNSTTKYRFPIKHIGRYFVRFHFFPFTYKIYNLSNAKFYVSVPNCVLMSDYTPPLFGTIKEYSVYVSSKDLEIVLVPSPSSVAFLNALEVFSVPNALIQDDATFNNPQDFANLPNTTLETFFRINMGGPIVNQDNDALWRTWKPDDSFLETKENSVKVHNIGVVHYRSGLSTRNFAPIAVYGATRRLNIQNSFNITWKFNVDLDFQYLVRFHFCDIVSSSRNKMYFNVFVNSWLVSRTLNLTGLAHGFLATPLYIDFVTPIIKGNEFSVSIGPVMTNKFKHDAILNGLEIMKIRNRKFSLATVTSAPIFKQESSNNHIGVLVWGIVGGVSILVLAITIILFSWNRRKSEVSRLPSGMRLPLAHIKMATDNFDDNRLIGKGGFGKVYKGVLEDGGPVAVKRHTPNSEQGLHEFRTEIELLSNFRHLNLVTLIGYCDESKELILVYEYVENGNLEDHLFGNSNSPLNWEKRLEICTGVARGLNYLHNESPTSIIHRDIKLSNILLDKEFIPKICDLGLGKVGVKHDLFSIRTAVKGTIGYIDPNYCSRQTVRKESDVYSFGIVLLQVLCGKPVVDNTGHTDLVAWAKELLKKRQYEQIIDSNLQTIKPEVLEMYAKTLKKCIAAEVAERPSIKDVLYELVQVGKLQNNTPHDEASTSRQHEDTKEQILEDQIEARYREMEEAIQEIG